MTSLALSIASQILAAFFGNPWKADMHVINDRFDARLSQALVSTFAPSSYRSVLDVGCGLGRYLAGFASAGTLIVHGIEPHEMSAHWRGGQRAHQFTVNVASNTAADVKVVPLPHIHIILSHAAFLFVRLFAMMVSPDIHSPDFFVFSR